MAIEVTLVPSLPSEGWLSMNRYWDALTHEVDSYKDDEFRFRFPIKSMGVLSGRSGRLNLAIQKKILYPAKIRLTARSGVAHILDHSYAFLQPSVPRGVKTVITVHDLLPLREPDGLSQASLARFRRRVEWVKRADLILSDSEATRLDLVNFISADPALIRVLPLGTTLPPDDVTPPRENLGPYLFSIGACMKRKNLEILPEILRNIRATYPDIRLVRAGGALPPALVAEFERQCGAGALLELGRVSEDRLASLYASALVTLVPSHLEGFGLPVLEAMAHGCPVVAADATSLPEVGGDVALYFPPDQPLAAVEKIFHLLRLDPGPLETLRIASRKRAQTFSWERHFASLLQVYRELG